MSRVSVALCTFNGSRYLPAQLRSVIDQTKPPDEVVVCDDASSDETWSLLETFRDTAPFPVRLFRNPSNLGFVRNFEQALSLCEGDLIALCDQDDVWLPHRLDVARSEFEQNPRLLLTFSDAEIIDGNDRLVGERLWSRIGYSKQLVQRTNRGNALDVLLKHSRVTGATVMLRRSLLEVALPIPVSWVHDAWLAMLAASLERIKALEEPLIYYRLHGANAIGASVVSVAERIERAGDPLRDGRRQMALRYEALRDRVKLLSKLDRHRIAEILEACDHHLTRASLPSGLLSRSMIVFREFASGRYQRFSGGLQSAIKDLIRRV